MERKISRRVFLRTAGAAVTLGAAAALGEKGRSVFNRAVGRALNRAGRFGERTEISGGIPRIAAKHDTQPSNR